MRLFATKRIPAYSKPYKGGIGQLEPYFYYTMAYVGLHGGGHIHLKSVKIGFN